MLQMLGPKLLSSMSSVVVRIQSDSWSESQIFALTSSSSDTSVSFLEILRRLAALAAVRYCHPAKSAKYHFGFEGSRDLGLLGV